MPGDADPRLPQRTGRATARARHAGNEPTSPRPRALPPFASDWRRARTARAAGGESRAPAVGAPSRCAPNGRGTWCTWIVRKRARDRPTRGARRGGRPPRRGAPGTRERVVGAIHAAKRGEISRGEQPRLTRARERGPRPAMQGAREKPELHPDLRHERREAEDERGRFPGWRRAHGGARADSASRSVRAI